MILGRNAGQRQSLRTPRALAVRKSPPYRAWVEPRPRAVSLVHECDASSRLRARAGHVWRARAGGCGRSGRSEEARRRGCRGPSAHRWIVELGLRTPRRESRMGERGYHACMPRQRPKLQGRIPVHWIDGTEPGVVRIGIREVARRGPRIQHKRVHPG
jgi:hypothetical protein